MDAIVNFLIEQADSFYWAITVFVIFVLILIKAGVKPIVSALDAREAKIKTELEESEVAYSKAKDLQAQLDEQLRGAEAKISEMMAEARRDGETAKAALLEEGRVELEATRQRTMREIKGAHQAALVEVRKEMADIATLAASKIMSRELDTNAHQDLVFAAVEELAAQAEAN